MKTISGSGIYWVLVLFMAVTVVAQPVLAQDNKTDDQISATLTPANKSAIFNNGAKYTFDVKNSSDNVQVGRVSYLVTTENGKKLREDSTHVRISRRSSASYTFEIPESEPGFYKVNFMINVSDYDDTIREAFGVRPEKLISTHPKPADFDTFWQKTKDELAKVKPEYKVTMVPERNTSNRYVYAIEMKSLDDMTIRGWMTIPKTVDQHRKFPVLLGLPGYQVGLEPMVGPDEDMAIITLNVRGQGNSRGPIATRRDEFIFYHIDDKNKYVMRGVITDCLRCIDFICSRPELRHDNILVAGGSMGGFLAIATASLDKRVAICSAQNPILCDVRSLPGEVSWPISTIKQYIAVRPGLTMEKVMGTLDYFDTKNFASNLTCPTLIGIGLLDPIAPPSNEYVAYNGIPGNKKRMMAYKDLGHEINFDFKIYEARWIRDTFALF
jgi:cephalosporin-C deacetylase